MNFEKCWNVIFNISCIIACNIQLSNIVFSYFNYSIVTHVKYNSPKWIISPDVHLCIVTSRQPEIRSKLSIFNPLFKTVEIVTQEHQDILYETLTVTDLLDNTPNLRMESCLIRVQGGHNVQRGNASQCSNIYSIQKYLFQQYVCYRINDRRKKMYRAPFIGKYANSCTIYSFLIHRRIILLRAIDHGNIFP